VTRYGVDGLHSSGGWRARPGALVPPGTESRETLLDVGGSIAIHEPGDPAQMVFANIVQSVRAIARAAIDRDLGTTGVNVVAVIVRAGGDDLLQKIPDEVRRLQSGAAAVDSAPARVILLVGESDGLPRAVDYVGVVEAGPGDRVSIA
jgi:hypothetical protein